MKWVQISIPLVIFPPISNWYSPSHHLLSRSRCARLSHHWTRVLFSSWRWYDSQGCLWRSAMYSSLYVLPLVLHRQVTLLPKIWNSSNAYVRPVKTPSDGIEYYLFGSLFLDIWPPSGNFNDPTRVTFWNIRSLSRNSAHLLRLQFSLIKQVPYISIMYIY